MKILIIGSGGREHTLAWKFAQSKKVEKVFVAPGNGGTASETKCENVLLDADSSSAEGQEKIKQFALRENIDFIVIGPEMPLAMGIADTLRESGLAVIGPGKNAAQLESSKIYSKAFMEKYGVRTALGKSFTDLQAALSFASDHFKTADCSSLVIKADGLAAGKGVVIAQDFAEAENALAAFMRDKSLGDAGTSILFEEFLKGKEVSVLAAVSSIPSSVNKSYILPFISARDHKRRFEGASGPNTGGMGAIAPVPDFTPEARQDFMDSILNPTLKGIIAEGLDYRGFIFFGLMVFNDRCSLLEYNVRLGDPETQAVLPLMDFDLVDLCQAILEGNDFPLVWKNGAVCAPVAVAEGYPGSYRKGDTINFDTAALEKSGAKVFISGAVLDTEYNINSPSSSVSPRLREMNIQKKLQTSGGRVLTVSAFGKNAEEARESAYKGMEAVNFTGMGYRKDIGNEL